MTDTTYNGWSSYATWRVNLELCDENCQTMAEDVSAGYRDRFSDSTELADYLKELAEQAVTQFDQLEDCLAIDYAMAFLSDVNWYEIASHWTDELIAEEEEIA